MQPEKNVRFGELFSPGTPSGFQVDFIDETPGLKLSPAVRFPLVISTISDAELTGSLKTATEQVGTYILLKMFHALSTKSHR